MRYALLAALLLGAVSSAHAQDNVLTINGTTVGAPTAQLPAFGSTSGSCALAPDAEPYQAHGFFGNADGSYDIDVVEPISVVPGTDDTILLVYEDSFDPAAPCTNFVAIGNETAGAGLTTTLSSAVQYELVVAGFWGSEDAYEVSITGPEASTVSEGTLPVELTAFEAVRDGADGLLRWSTASETGNAGFEVQRQVESAWQVLGFVEGRGTTSEAQHYAFRAEGLGPGRHVLRLKQIDHDGTSAFSPEVEVEAALAGPFVLEAPYPNPFHASATVRFAVREAQPVRVALYDALGRLAVVLYDGTPAAGEHVSVRIDAQGRPSGAYFVRLTGEGFEAVQRITLLK